MKEREARALLSHAPNGEFGGAVREVIRRSRESGWLSINRVAVLAGVSVRTLQRRLAREDVVFSDLVDGVRRDIALEMLRDSEITLEEIAGETGYSAGENFIRAFRRWTGKTPAEFRQCEEGGR